MNEEILYVVVSELVSLVLIVYIWTRKEKVVFKLLFSAIVVVPFVGPLLYAFASNKTPPQDPMLQNRSARGAYSDNWVLQKEKIKREIAKLEKEGVKHEPCDEKK